MTDQTTTQRRDGHLTVYLAWPVLVGLTLAAVLALSVGGLALLGTGDLARSATLAGQVFLVVLGLGTVGMIVFVLGEWRGPAGIERLRRSVELIEPDAPDPEIRFIRLGGRRPALTTPAPRAPSADGGIGRAIDTWAQRFKKAPIATYEGTAATIEPDAAPWVKDFYTVLCTAWGAGSLSRRTFEGLWSGGRGKRLWAKYVNGTGSRHSQKGLWDTWGIIAKTGVRGTWEWTQTLDVIFSLDRDLAAYARARAELVGHPPTTPGDGTGPGTSTDQTRPNQRTRPNGGRNGA